jgi:hypothetical protein
MDNTRHYTRFSIKDAIIALCYAGALALPLSACNDSNNPTLNTPAPSSGQPSNQAPEQTPELAPATPTVQEGFSLNSLLNSLDQATSDVQVAVAPHANAVQARTKEEVDKLFRWEYRVLEVPSETQAPELEARLTKLGDEGWECFDMTQTQTNQTRITCKRRPKSALSYLKYIPGL